MEELNYIGICPICGKGKMVEGSLGFSCNHFTSMEDKCLFNIYHTYFGKKITEDIAKELITTGKTEVFHDLQKKDGTTFSASLVIDKELKKVVPKFANEVLDCKCPKCGGDVENLLSGYACSGYMDKKCDFFIAKVIAGKDITKEMAEELISKRKTKYIGGFKKKDGTPFSAALSLDQTGSVKFSNILCKCPKCGGDVYVNNKAYSCSNYKSEPKCDFVIWNQIYGRTITPEEAICLCEKGETEILDGFKKGEEILRRKLVLSEDKKVKLV